MNIDIDKVIAAGERERQRMNRRALLEVKLRQAHVSLEIVERVLRLNPDPEPGVKLRGIHYAETAQSYRYARFMSKGHVIRKHGREVFNRIPRAELIKDGRRVYVPYEALLDFGGVL